MGNQVTNMQTHIHTNTNPIKPEFERRSKDRSKQVHHWRNLLWWIALICVIVAVVELPRFFSSAVEPSLAMPMLSVESENKKEKEIAIEKEAFIALAFGKVSATHELAISKDSFKAQLESLKQADYSSVRLEQINQWKQTSEAPLPAKPVLLTFEEANLETMEIADKILAKLGMTALVFVDVNQLNQGNITLVSWHRLEQLVKTGRWEVGISGCLNTSEEQQADSFPKLLAEKLSWQREQLENQLHVPVIAANCSRSWNSDNGYDASSAWNKILADASFQIGFVAAPFGANYHKDPKTSFRRIRVSKTWNETELLTQIKTHEPRRATFSDTFQSNQLVSDWVVDSGELSIEKDSLHMARADGEQGAMIALGGTEKWQDAEVEVQLNGLPEGQFWVSLRHGADQPYIRLGIAKGQVLLQETNGMGKTKQFSSRDLPLNEVTLKLRVVGVRVIAYLNGQALTERPVELESNIKEGAFALTVWNDSESLDEFALNRASVSVAQVKAAPLFPKNAIVAPVLEESVWATLRQQAEQLSAISPRYFSWADRKKAEAFQVSDSSMEIFAHYHHLQLLPALHISGDTPLSDASALIDQAIVWASNPDYHGLNIVLQDAMAEDKWRPALNKLNNKMNDIGKMLSVTIIESEEQFMATMENDPLFLVSTKTDLLTSLPRFLYPLTTNFTDL